jgi:hypothetical protein
MTAISIHEFQDRAGFGDLGEIRIAKDDANRLNRGTLGERFVSWLRDVKESFGDRDATRADRQRQALEGFRRALKDYYGQAIGEQAFLAQGLGLPGRTNALTGAEVRAAIEHADTLRMAGRLRAEGALAPLLPGGEAFDGLVRQALGDDAPPLSFVELREYQARLGGGVGALDPRTARPEDVRAIAETTLRRVRELSDQGLLARAGAARQGLVAGLRTVLLGLSYGALDPGNPARQDTLRALAAMSRDILDQRQIEGIEDPQERKALVRAALGEVLRELGEDGADLLRKAQSQILSEPWRALRGRVGAPTDQALEVIVEVLAEQRGAQTGSVAGDRTAFRTDAVSPEAQDRARRSAGTVRDTLAQPGRVLGEIKRAFGEHDRRTGEVRWAEVDGRPAWDSVALLEQLERGVREHAQRSRQRLPDAIADIRQTIAQDRLPEELAAKLEGALDTLALEARAEDLLGCRPGGAWPLLFPPEPPRWQLHQMGEGQPSGRLGDLVAMLESEQGPLDELFGLQEFRAAIATAEDDDARRALVAQALRGALQGGDLDDGAAANMLLQRLLRDAGLPPAILSPGQGLAELTAEHVRVGQSRYQIERMSPGLSAEGDFAGSVWSRDFSPDGPQHQDFEREVRERLASRATETTELREIPVTHQFMKDLDRVQSTVEIAGQWVRLDEESTIGALTELVRDQDNPDAESDGIAVLELSALINQEVANELGLRSTGWLLGPDSVVTNQGPSGIVSVEARRVEDEALGPSIEIAYRDTKHGATWQNPNGTLWLKEERSVVRTECVLRVPLSELREPGGHASFVLRPPVLRIALEPGEMWDDDHRHPGHLMLVERDGRQRAAINVTVDGAVRGARERLKEQGETPESAQDDRSQRSLDRLLDPQLMADFVAEARDKLRLGDAELPRSVQVSDRGDSLEVEFRYQLPDGFPGDGVVLHGWDGAPPEGPFDIAVRLQVKKADLDSGYPDRFVVIEGAQVEPRQ